MKKTRIKLQVGQLWKFSPDSCTKYTVKEIVPKGDKQYVYVVDEEGRRDLFSIADRDCYSEFSEDWIMISAPTPRSRECKCGIFRGDCTYHKDQ